MCEGVDYRSATFDPFLDLSLEINKANSLTRALQHFTAEEVLDGDNRYRCPKNNKLVSVCGRRVVSASATPSDHLMQAPKVCHTSPSHLPLSFRAQCASLALRYITVCVQLLHPRSACYE